MLGRMGLEFAQYGAAPALSGSPTTETLANAMSRLLAVVYIVAKRQSPAPVNTKSRLLGQSMKVGHLAGHPPTVQRPSGIVADTWATGRLIAGVAG